MLYRIRITDLMTRATEVTVLRCEVESVDDLRARCRRLREEFGEAIHVEAVRARRVALPNRRLSWAVA